QQGHSGGTEEADQLLEGVPARLRLVRFGRGQAELQGREGRQGRCGGVHHDARQDEGPAPPSEGVRRPEGDGVPRREVRPSAVFVAIGKKRTNLVTEGRFDRSWL